MNTEQPAKPHYAWKILIACCLLNMSALGMTNSNGLFFNEIIKELGFELSSLMTHNIFFGLTSAAVLFVVDRVYRKFPLRLVLAVSFLLYHLPFMAMGAFTKVWQWCAAAMVSGIGAAFLLYIPVPMLLNSWFIKKKKMALSLCFVASGFSGILLSLMLGVLISRFGWRASYVIRGAVLLLLTVPVLILAVKTPQEMGLEPYGAGEAPAEDQKYMGASRIRISFEEKRKRYLGCIVLAVLCNIVCALVSMLPHFAGTLGYDVVFASYLTSMAMVGNISSKAAMGPATEKLGVRRASLIVVLVMTFGFFVVAAGFTSMPAILFVSCTCGMSACVNTLVVPNMLDTFASGDEYVHMLSRCSTGTMFASAFTVTLGSLMLEAFGGYRPVFLVYGLVGLTIAAILLIVFRPLQGEQTRRSA